MRGILQAMSSESGTKTTRKNQSHPIDVALLGTGGTMPLPNRYLSSVLVRFGGQRILFDCGEGTQVSLRQLDWGLKDISHVVITHFHADHVAGLPGLLLTVGNSGREEPLSIIGPPGIQRVVESLRIIAPHLPFEIRYIPLTGTNDKPVEIDALRLTCALGDHGMACLAYRLDLFRIPAFQPDKARALGLPVENWKILQNGEAVPHEGRMVQPEEVLGPPRPGLAMGFLTDSRPTARLIDFFTDVDLLVSEATYGDPADIIKAKENKHMTFGEAAALAAAAGAKRLWLTHFSPALPNPDYFRREAECLFPGVVIGRDGITTTLSYAD